MAWVASHTSTAIARSANCIQPNTHSVKLRSAQRNLPVLTSAHHVRSGNTFTRQILRHGAKPIARRLTVRAVGDLDSNDKKQANPVESVSTPIASPAVLNVSESENESEAEISGGNGSGNGNGG
eukprot:CAMPEP_0198209890 /NCGR_PEP_ID=MMETSP1445-20131203/17800_1 /TAXON_ID=36898 /ORGANISM="Pyramimonas sp., Strain CCMP2087" /LENGTH=123 /DNA_ID=CAMNT_0043883801 /DNA_START=127 /DNA_END=494 /DNA_ORIENTATION=+